MIRYVKQRDAYSCGTIALINALKWSGRDVTYKDFRRVKKIANTRPRLGTTSARMKRVLHRCKRTFKVTEAWDSRMSVSDLDRHLEAGRTVILCYYWWFDRHTKKCSYTGLHCNATKFTGHFVFIEGKQGGRYKVVNNSRRRTVNHITRKTMINMLGSRVRCSNGISATQAWVLEKT